MNPSYYIDGGADSANMTARKNFCWESWSSQNAALWQQGYLDTKFKAGDQQLTNFVYGNPTPLQKKLSFNIIPRHVNMICGRQRQMRKSTIVIGTHEEADQEAEDYTELTLYSERKEGAQEYISEAFEGAITTGLSFLHLFPQYTNDPYSGEFSLDNVSFLNILCDPNWKKMDMSDCYGLWRRRWVNRDSAINLIPGREDEIKNMRAMGIKDGKFPLQAELVGLNVSNLMPYDEFYFQDTREATMILDPISGESYEFKKRPWEPEDTLDRILAKEPWLKVHKTRKPTVKLSIALNNRELYLGPNLLGIDRYPLVPVVGYHEPDMPYSYKFRGIVRDLRDPQWLYNRVKVIQLEMMESQPNSGWIYPVDAITDERAFRQTLNGVLIPLKKGHKADEIQKIQSAHIDDSIFQLSQGLLEDFSKITGVNEELLGASEDDQAGILAMVRQSAGLTTLQSVFDRLDYSQRLLGSIRCEAMQENWTKGKIRSILKRDVDEKFFFKDVLKLNLAVEEGPYSSTQRQLEFKQMLYLRTALEMPISNETIINKSLVFGKKKLIEELKQGEQQKAQQMQAQAQSEAQAQRSEEIVKVAKAKLDLAKARESEAKVVEIHSGAEQKQAAADLDLVKSMIGLEDMQFTQFRNSFEMADFIRTSNLSHQQNQNQMALGGV